MNAPKQRDAEGNHHEGEAEAHEGEGDGPGDHGAVLLPVRAAGGGGHRARLVALGRISGRLLPVCPGCCG